MTKEGMNKFLAAVKAADMKSYQFDSDLGTHFYHNSENAILYTNDDLNLMTNVRRIYTKEGTPYEGQCLITCADYGDLHEVRVGGTAEQAKTFLEAMGITPTEEELKIIVSIDRSNYQIIPMTGDYNSKFVKLTDDEIANLTPEEKKKYEAELAKFEADQKAAKKKAAPIRMDLF